MIINPLIESHQHFVKLSGKEGKPNTNQPTLIA